MFHLDAHGLERSGAEARTSMIMCDLSIGQVLCVFQGRDSERSLNLQRVELYYSDLSMW